MTETRKPLTATTWDHYYVFEPDTISQCPPYAGRHIGWEEQADLEEQFAALGYDREMVRALMYGARSANPIRLVWNTAVNSDVCGHSIHRETTYVIVQYIIRPTGANHDRIQIRYCGFGHAVYLSQIVSAEVPKTTIEYLD